MYTIRYNMSKQIISQIESKTAFFHLLEHNPGLIILKFGATWCGPCKKIEPIVHGFFATSPDEVVCGDIDIDDSFEVYAFLKNKKMVNGIPVMLCYKKGNETFIPDDSITSADPVALDAFFKRCGANLALVKKMYPGKEKTKEVNLV